jgi:arylformamidase
MTEIIRLSHSLSNRTPSYGNRDSFKTEPHSSIRSGDSADTSVWHFTNNHIGTHLDVPRHFCTGGRTTLEYPETTWLFEKVVTVDCPCSSARLIMAEELRPAPTDPETEAIFIRTGYERFRSEDKYWNDNPGLAPELAVFLRSHFPRLRCVGFDFISLSSWKYREQGRECHKRFLCPENKEREILVIEDMSLMRIRGSIRRVIVSPLFVEDGNGGPVTIFAELDGGS